MENQSRTNDQNQLFKNPSDVGLPSKNKKWEPKDFIQKWKAIIKNSQRGLISDLLAVPWIVSPDGKHFLVPPNAVLIPYHVRLIYLIAFDEFKLVFQNLPIKDKALFVTTELKAAEKKALLKMSYSANDLWQEVEHFIYNEYIDWLLSIAPLSKKDSQKNMLLPDLLKNRGQMNIINNWLEDPDNGPFIEKYRGDETKPYKWLGVNNNEALGITSLINADREDIEDNLKVRHFSLQYQLAAFGYWLYDNELFQAKSSGEGLCRAVAGYYNMEIDQTMSKAFRPGAGNRENLKGYYVYFERLSRVLK